MKELEIIGVVLLALILILLLFLVFGKKEKWTPTQDAKVVNALSNVKCDCKDCVKPEAVDKAINCFVRKVEQKWTPQEVLACVGNVLFGVVPPKSACKQEIMDDLNTCLEPDNCSRTPLIL